MPDPPPSTLLPPLRAGGLHVRVAAVPDPSGAFRVVQVFEDVDDEPAVAGDTPHPNLTTVRAFAASERGPVLLADWTPGALLAEVLQACAARDRPLPPHVAVRILLDVCEAAAALHAAGIAHGAIHPRAIHLGTDGTARLLERSLAIAPPATGETRATRRRRLSYTAPEVLAGEAPTRRSDVFSMGVLGWELLAGRRLFGGERDHDTTRRVVAEQAPRISDAAPHVASYLDNAIAKALAKAPEARYADLGELWIAVDRIASRHDWIGTADEVAAHLERVLGEEIAARTVLVHEVLCAAVRSCAPATGEAAPPTTEPQQTQMEAAADAEGIGADTTCELPARTSSLPPSETRPRSGGKRLALLALAPVAAVVALAFVAGGKLSGADDIGWRGNEAADFVSTITEEPAPPRRPVAPRAIPPQPAPKPAASAEPSTVRSVASVHVATGSVQAPPPARTAPAPRHPAPPRPAVEPPRDRPTRTAARPKVPAAVDVPANPY